MAGSAYDDRAYRKARARLSRLPCAYCGADPPSTVDHVIPLMAGGTNARTNLVPACQRCNSRRGNAMQKARRRRRWRNPKW